MNPMRFFFDRCCPPRLAAIIDTFDESHTVRHFSDDNRFVHDTPDIEWLRVLAADTPKWIVVSMDGRILRSPIERQALAECGLKFFLLGSGWMKMTMHDKAWKLLKTWPNIVAEAATSRNLLFEVSAGSSLKVEVLR